MINVIIGIILWQIICLIAIAVTDEDEYKVMIVSACLPIVLLKTFEFIVMTCRGMDTSKFYVVHKILDKIKSMR